MTDGPSADAYIADPAAGPTIDRLRARVAELEAIITAVDELHRPDSSVDAWCSHDSFAWPCRTHRALEARRTERDAIAPHALADGHVEPDDDERAGK